MQSLSVRLPEKVREWIRTKAKENRRSMNAEFLLIIEIAMKKAKEKKENDEQTIETSRG